MSKTPTDRMTCPMKELNDRNKEDRFFLSVKLTKDGDDEWCVGYNSDDPAMTTGDDVNTYYAPIGGFLNNNIATLLKRKPGLGARLKVGGENVKFFFEISYLGKDSFGQCVQIRSIRNPNYVDAATSSDSE